MATWDELNKSVTGSSIKTNNISNSSNGWNSLNSKAKNELKINDTKKTEIKKVDNVAKFNEAGKSFFSNPYQDSSKLQSKKTNTYKVTTVEPIKINTGIANSTQAIPDKNTPNIGVNEVLGAPVGLLGGAIGATIGTVGGAIKAKNKGLEGKEYWDSVGKDAIGLAKEMYVKGTDIGAAGTKLGIATAVAPELVGAYFTAMTGIGIFNAIVNTKDYTKKLKDSGSDYIALQATNQYLKNGSIEGWKMIGADEEVAKNLTDNNFFNAVGNVLLYGSAYLASKGTLKSSKTKLTNLSDFLTKEKIIEYKLPRTVKISPQEVYDIYSGKAGYENNLSTIEKGQFLSTLKLTSEEISSARKNGIDIELPTEVVTKLVDKPWFSKIKKSLNIKSAEKVISTEQVGATTRTPTALIEGPKAKSNLDTVNLKISEEIKSGNNVSEESIKSLSAAKNYFNNFIQTNKQSVISYTGTPSPSGNIPKLNIDIVKISDNEYLASIEASYGQGTLISSFDTSNTFKSSQEAILSSKSKIMSWVDSQESISGSSSIELQDLVNTLNSSKSLEVKNADKKESISTEDDLIKEAKKYKTADEFIKNNLNKTDYRSAHQLSLSDSITADKIDIPKLKEDIRARNGYLNNYNLSDLKKLEKLKNNPNADVKIFRASPKNELNDGDWVTTDRNYANDIKRQNGGKVYEYTVKVKDLRFPKDTETLPSLSMASTFSYSPKTRELNNIWNKANKPDNKIDFSKNRSGLTLKTFEFLKGKETVSRQYISDLTNRNDIKQQERDIIRQVLEGITSEKINVEQFISDVEAELLPLKRVDLGKSQDIMNGDTTLNYEFVTLPDNIRGPVANYSEIIYESPIITSAGDVHFRDSGTKKYFGHVRIEDMASGAKITGTDVSGNPIYDFPDQSGKTEIRRIIEVQSDLYQKGRLERERGDASLLENLSKEDYKEYTDLSSRHQVMNLNETDKSRMFELINKAESNLQEKTKPLIQYNDPTAHFRMVREEIKKASKDKVKKLQFPTGETAMKIEGLGEQSFFKSEPQSTIKLIPEQLKVGREIYQHGGDDAWIITEILGDGKFKAIPKQRYELKYNREEFYGTPEEHANMIKAYEETFDISGKINTNNPIYKFYENKLSRYLKNKYDAKLVVDNQGVSWFEVNVKPEYATQPVEAFSKLKDISEFNNRNKGVQALDEYFDGEKLFKNLQKDMKRLGLDFDIALYDKIFTGEMAKNVITKNGMQTLRIIPEEASGVVYNNRLALSRNALRFTEKHELGHIILNNLDNIPAFSKYNKAEILNEANKIYGKKYNEENLDEVVSRGLEDFVYHRTSGWSGKLKGFFAKLLYQIKQILHFNRKINLKSYYEDILYSKSRTTTKIEPKPGKSPIIERGGRKILNFGNREKASFSKANIQKDFDPNSYVQEKISDAKKAGELELTKLEKIKKLSAESKSKLVDFTAPIEDTLYRSLRENKIKLKPSEDIHNQIDRVLRTPTLAGQFVKDTGFDKVIREVDNLDNLDQYLIAKHAIELDKLGIETGRDLEKDAKLIDSFKNKYESYAQKVINYSHYILDYAVSSGLISPELRSKLIETYPNYVPFNRIFNEVEQNKLGYGGKSVASLSRQNIIQKIEGSKRQIESPIGSLLAKTADVFKQGEKNKAARILASYKDLPGNPFELEEITSQRPLLTGEESISYLDNGIKKTFAVNPDVARAAKALDVQKLNILGQIFAFPTRIARLGITSLNIPFVVSNILKDQITAFINSNNSLATSVLNPKVVFKTLLEISKHGDLYQEIARSGGSGTSYDISRNQISPTIKKIRAGRSIFSRIKYTATNPLELIRVLEDVIGISEQFTRTKQYIGTKKALIKKGYSEAEARIGAARAYNEDTVNFARRGEWGQVLNSAFLYLNAGIQGTRNLLRNLKNKPGRTAVKIGISAIFPVILATIYNLNDEDSKNVYDDIPEWEKQNNIIIIPPGTKLNKKGKYNVIKIPVSQEINNLTNLARKYIESLYGSEKIAFKDVASSLFGTITPFSLNIRETASQLIPQALKPTIEGLANTDLYTGNNIVSKYMVNVPVDQQVYENTSGTARKIGAVIGVSPLQVEHFLKSTFGEVALQIENASDKILNAMGYIPSSQIGGRGIIEGTLRRFATASAGAINQENKDELNAALGEISGKLDQAEQKFKPTYEKIVSLFDEGKDDEAQKIINDLSDSQYTIYKSLKKADDTKKTNQAKIEVYPKYTKWKQLIDSGNESEAQKILDDMTDDEYKAFKSVRSSLSKDTGSDYDSPSVQVIESSDQNNFFSDLILYAKSIGADPVTAFNRIFTGQKITKLVNGTIIVERMSLEESQKIKEERGGKNESWKLDHTIPLELGGSNSASNLELIPTDVWASYTAKENELGRKLKNGEITKKEAQQQILEFKNKSK